jgi:radical SAM superfamily enzyme YgiQ (UPF0313 family)
MITLINPPFSDKNTDYFFYQKGRYPHPGISYIGGYLEKRGLDIRIIDAKYYDYAIADIIELLKKDDNKIVGLTSNTSEINNTLNLIESIKKSFPEKFIILGGIHACALPEETVSASPYLDAIAFTEGEGVLFDLAASTDIYDVLPGVPGVIFRQNGQIINNGRRELPTSLKGYGPAKYDYWGNAKKYFVMTYRGCPFACSFCFRALGKQVRARDIEDVMVDLMHIAGASGDIDVNIFDATFGLTRKHTEKILEEIIREKLDKRFKWTCTTRVDVMDKDLLKLMKEAGCYSVAFGIESGSDDILKGTGKNTKIAQGIKIVGEAKKLGLQTVGYYIFGHPGETKKDIQKTINAVWKINTNEVRVGIMVPWPGTKVYEMAKANQGGYKLLSEDYSKFDKYFGNVMSFDNFSLKYLDVMRIVAFAKLYLYNFRFKDITLFLIKNYKQVIKKIQNIIQQ